MTYKRHLKMALGATTALVLATGQLRAADEVVIGLATASSGFMTAYDGGPSQSVEMFIEELNAKGGLLGKTLKLVKSDTKSDIAQGAKAGIDVIDQGAQMAIVSCDYDFGAPAANEIQKAGKISFFTCADDVKAGVVGVGPASFTAGIAAVAQGAAIAQWGAEKKGFKSAYILRDTSIEYNKSVCNGFEWMIGQLQGVTLLGQDTWTNSDPSISSQVSRIKALPEQPDYIMVCSYIPGGASAIKQLRAAGIESTIVNGHAMDGTYWMDTVPDLSNFYFPALASVHGDDPRAGVQEFNARFAKRWGNPPVTLYTYAGWSAMELWATAVERAGSFETEAVVAELEKLNVEPTLFGPRTFSPEFHIQKAGDFLIIGTEKGKMSVIDEWKFDTELPVGLLFGQL